MLRKNSLILLLVFILCVSVIGCGNSEKNTGIKTSDSETKHTETKKDEVSDVKLRWYVFMNKQDTCDEVFAEVNEYVKEKLGFEIEIVPLDEYNDKMQVINAGGDSYDLAFTSNWCNNYTKNVSDGVLAPLDDLIEEYAPNLRASMSSSVWDATRINGEIYGVPNQQIMARSPLIAVASGNFEYFGFDASEYENASLSDYEAYLRKFKEETGEYTKIVGGWFDGQAMEYGIQDICGSKIPGAIRFREDGKPEVINQFDSDEFLEYITLRRKWVEEGLASPVVVTVDDVKQYADITDEIVPVMVIGINNKPGVEAEMKATYGIELDVITSFEPLLYTGGVTATLTGVSANSEHKEAAMQFLELVNTDKELMNLLCYGIEGKHYDKISDNTIKLNTENSYITSNWAMGNVFNCYVLEGQAEDTWEQTKAINDSAFASPLIGFTADTESVSTEVANCSAVVAEYFQSLDKGVVDINEEYPEFISKLETAGVQTIIDELQRQVDEWWTNK